MVRFERRATACHDCHRRNTRRWRPPTVVSGFLARCLHRRYVPDCCWSLNFSKRNHRRSDYLYPHRVDRVVAVAQMVPLGAFRLGPAGDVGGARPDSDRARLKTRDQLPPLPSRARPFADQPRFAPRPVIQAYIDLRRASGAGSGDAADCCFVARQEIAGCRTDRSPSSALRRVQRSTSTDQRGGGGVSAAVGTGKGGRGGCSVRPAGDVVGAADAASGCVGVCGGTGAAAGCLGASARTSLGTLFRGGPCVGAGSASGEIFSLTFCRFACTVATSRDNCSCLPESCSTSRRITARSFATAMSCCLNSATSLACIEAAAGVGTA
jgi:hypothetical protein